MLMRLRIKQPQKIHPWVEADYPTTRFYILLLYSLILIQIYKIRMWRKFNIRWELADYDEY